MEKIEEPKAGESVFVLWRVVVKCVAFVNAFLNFKVLTTTGKTRFDISNGNAVLQLNIAAVVQAVTPRRNWAPYSAPQGGLYVKIRECFIHDGRREWVASNKNASFLVPPNCTDGYYFWLALDIGPNGQITACQYQHGVGGPPVPPPPNLLTGAPPAKAYYRLCSVTSNATAVDDFSNVIAPDRPITLRAQGATVPGSGVVSSLLLYFDPAK